MSTDHRKTVVVVGGGAAGATIAKDLAGTLDFSKHNLILVNDRPFYLHRIAALRAHVTPQGNFDERMQIPYDGIFPNENGKLVVGTVTSIVERDDGGYVELNNGEKISYSALVLATGSNWGGPADIQVETSDISTSVNSWRSKVEKANNILIVGGGAIGIELAGEIKEFFPSKKVTIVHGQDHLLNDTYPARYRTRVDRLVRSKGIELVLNDVVPEKYFNEAPSSVTSITTKTGHTIGTDFLISARGPKPNTGFIGASLGENVLDAAGQVRVEPTLQLPSHPRIFAAGDITNLREQKQAMKAGSHGATIVPNVLAVLNGQVPSKKYKGAYEIIALTVGLDGVSYMGLLWGIILGGWVTGILKSKDLVVNMTRGRLGVKN